VVDALAAAKPDLTFAPVFYDTMIDVAKAATARGLAGDAFLGSDGWAGGDELLRAFEGARFLDHWHVDAPYDRSRQFVAEFTARFKRAPDAIAALTYDAVHLLVDAIARASMDDSEAPTRAGVRETLATTRAWAG